MLMRSVKRMIWYYLWRYHKPVSDCKKKRDFNEVIKEITSIVDGPISGEVKGLRL